MGNDADEHGRDVTKSFGSHVKYSLLDSVGSTLLGMVFLIVCSRQFGAVTTGAFTVASMFVGAFKMISSAKEQSGLIRELTKYTQRSPIAVGLFWLTMLFSVGFTLALLIPFGGLSLWLLVDVYHHEDLIAPFLVLIIAYLGIDNTADNFSSPLVAYGHMKPLWLSRTAQFSVSILVALAWPLFFHQSVWGIVAATIIGSAIGLCWRAAEVFRFMGLVPSRVGLREARPHMRTVIGYGLRFGPANLNEVLIEYTDSAVLTASVSLADVGAYNRAYQIFKGMKTLGAAVNRMLFPALSRLAHAGDYEAMESAYRLVVRYLALILGPMAAFIAVYSRQIMSVFGPDFESAAPALAVLGLLAFVDVYGRMSGCVCAAANRPGIISWVTSGMAVGNVGLCLLLIPWIGQVGAAIANLVGLLLAAVVSAHFAAKSLGISLYAAIDGPSSSRTVLVSAVTATATFVVSQFVTWASFPVFIVMLSICLWLFKPLLRSDVDRFTNAVGSMGVKGMPLKWLISIHAFAGRSQ